MFDFNRFETLRKEKGITKKHIADALHRTPSICQDWKYGKSVPSQEQLEIVAQLLSTTPAYLTGESSEKEKTAASSSDDLTQELIHLISLLSPEEQKRELAYLREKTADD